MSNDNKKITSFTDLHTWQAGHSLALDVYELTKKFPDAEQFSLTSQMRRAAISITSNIAEGFSRSTIKDRVHFYIMSLGSLTELQNQALLSRDIGYITSEDFDPIAKQSVTVHKLLNGLIKSTKVHTHDS